PHGIGPPRWCSSCAAPAGTRWCSRATSRPSATATRWASCRSSSCRPTRRRHCSAAPPVRCSRAFLRHERASRAGYPGEQRAGPERPGDEVAESGKKEDDMTGPMIGKVYGIPPQPPVEENTRHFAAGAVSFGVEYRDLDPESLEET